MGGNCPRGRDVQGVNGLGAIVLREGGGGSPGDMCPDTLENK